MRRFLPLALVGLVLAGSVAAAQERYGPFTRGYRSANPGVIPCPCPPLWGGPVAPGVPGVYPPTSATPPAPVMEPPTPPPGGPEVKPPASLPPEVAPAPAPTPLDRAFANPYAQATEAGGQPSRSFNENFNGDFNGVFYRRYVILGQTTVPRTVVTPRVVGTTQRVTGFNPVTTSATTTNTTQVVTFPDGTGAPPVIVRTVTNTTTNTTTNNPVVVTEPVVVNDTTVVNDVVAFKRIVRQTLAARYNGVLITDNDNPRPQDRVYGGYTFYDDIGGAVNPGFPQTDLQRQLVGFEETFLGGDASFGMRLPFVQQYGGGLPGTQNVGDLSLLFKYAFFNNRETGDLVSAGFVLTTPTGSGSAILADVTRAPHSVLFQPWLGFVKTFDRAYLQGITSFVVPSDSRDPTLFNNSVAAGYYLMQNPNGFLTALVPVVELHVRTPLSNRNPDGLVFLQDQVNVNSGVHFRFGRATLSTSACVPLVGPRPWNVEWSAYFNYNF